MTVQTDVLTIIIIIVVVTSVTNRLSAGETRPMGKLERLKLLWCLLSAPYHMIDTHKMTKQFLSDTVLSSPAVQTII